MNRLIGLGLVAGAAASVIWWYANGRNKISSDQEKDDEVEVPSDIVPADVVPADVVTNYKQRN